MHEFTLQDCVTCRFLTTLRYQLWPFEPFVGYSHVYLRRMYTSYELLFESGSSTDKEGNLCGEIRQAFINGSAFRDAFVLRTPSDRDVISVPLVFPQLHRRTIESIGLSLETVTSSFLSCRLDCARMIVSA